VHSYVVHIHELGICQYTSARAGIAAQPKAKRVGLALQTRPLDLEIPATFLARADKRFDEEGPP